MSSDTKAQRNGGDALGWLVDHMLAYTHGDPIGKPCPKAIARAHAQLLAERSFATMSDDDLVRDLREAGNLVMSMAHIGDDEDGRALARKLLAHADRLSTPTEATDDVTEAREWARKFYFSRPEEERTDWLRLAMPAWLFPPEATEEPHESTGGDPWALPYERMRWHVVD